jgi:hypothetical protein
LDEFFFLADDSEANWEHTVSWIDCISGKRARGLFLRGNPTDAGPRPEPRSRNLTLPFMPPISLVNNLTLQALNRAYFNLKKWRAGRRISHYESFFYPLDNLLEWNRIYGPKGFFQYQSVVPREVGRDAIQAMLGEINGSGDGSLLAVLKTFGDRQSVGMLSFPRPGATLALDFPNKGGVDAETLQSAGRHRARSRRTNLSRQRRAHAARAIRGRLPTPSRISAIP